MYVLRNFNEMALVNTDLVELSFDKFYEIISDDMLNSKDEEPIWECCLSWIDHDPVNRRKYVKQLMEGVRLGLVNATVNERRHLDSFDSQVPSLSVSSRSFLCLACGTTSTFKNALKRVRS